jgi:DNA-binding beta-propeller fold protein YncE
MPKGIAVDKDGIVYVVDSLFDNVQLFNRKGDFLLTLGRRGTDAGEFWLPSGAFIGDHDDLYVCDTYNRRAIVPVTERYAEVRSNIARGPLALGPPARWRRSPFPLRRRRTSSCQATSR